MLKFIHAADFHLDSAFAALPPEKAAERRREQRQLMGRLAEAVRAWETDLVLLSGDLFDGKPYPETVEAVKEALAEMAVPGFLSPGNHDPFGPESPYAGDWPGNVHIFRTPQMESVPLRSLGAMIHGAAFTAPTSPRTITVTRPPPTCSLPMSCTLADFTMASAASMAPTRPLVSIIPNAFVSIVSVPFVLKNLSCQRKQSIVV